MVNPLWLGAANVNFSSMVTDIKTLYDSLSGPMDVQALATNTMNLPYAIPLIAFGALPIVFAVIALIACCPACCGACCCSAGSCYRKKNKRLQKVATSHLEQEHVSIHGLPSSQACQMLQNTMARGEVIGMLREVEARRQKAYKKAKCGQCCYFAWWVTSLLYVLAIIFVIVGMSQVFSIPNAMGEQVNKQTTTLTEVIGNASSTVDNFVLKVFGEDIKPMETLINGTTAELETALDVIKNKLSTASFITPLIDKLDIAVNGLLMGMSDLFKFTNKNDGGNQQYGDQNISRLFTDLGHLNGNLTDLFDIIDNLSPEAKTKMNNPDIPASIPDEISDAGIKSLVQIFVEAQPTFHTFMCKLSRSTLISALPAMITNIVLPYNATVDCSVADPRKQATITDLIDYRTMITDIITNLTGSWDSLASTIVSVQPYVAMLYKLTNITFTELVADMQLDVNGDATCTDPWCGILPYNSIGGASTTIRTMLPEFAASFLTFDSIDGALACLSPWLYGLALFLPILVILITWLVMACRKTCCSCFTMWCCPICNICTVLISFMLLMLTFIYSGVLKPITDQMQGNMTALVDTGFAASSLAGINMENVKTDLPTAILTNSMINVTLFKDDLDFNTTNTLVSSVKLNVQFDLSNMLPAPSGVSSGDPLMDMLGINMNDMMGMLNKPLTYLATNLSAYSDFNITLNGTDLSNIMSGTVAKGLLSLIQLNNLPILSFINSILKDVMNAVFEDTVKVLDGIIDPNITAINEMDNSFITSLGFDIASITALQSTINAAVSPVVTQIQGFQTDMQEQNDLIDFYALTTTMLKGGSAVTIADDATFLKGLSFLYGAQNEYLFMHDSPPPSNTRNLLVQKLITESNKLTSRQYIESLINVGVHNWLNSLTTMNAQCDGILAADGDTTMVNRFNARDPAIVYNKAAYCEVLKKYKMSNYNTLLTQLAELYDVVMVKNIIVPLQAIEQYSETTGIIGELPEVMLAIVKGAFTAVDKRLDFAYANNVFQPPFISSQFMSSFNTYVQDIMEAVIAMIESDQSILNTKLLSLIPSTLQGTFGVALGWLDSLSFAVYLMFLYYFLGSMFMAFSYSYVRLVQEEKRIEKKYKIKQLQKVQCGKSSYKPMGQQVPLIVSPDQILQSPQLFQ